MRYTYTSFKDGLRTDVTTNYNDIPEIVGYTSGYVDVYDNLHEAHVARLVTAEDFEVFREGLEKAHAWKDRPVAPHLHTHYIGEDSGADAANYIPHNIPPSSEVQKDHINPSHYKGFVKDMQWMEAQQYIIGERKGAVAFKAAVEMMARKYLDRNGGKDAELQELEKCLWYLKFLVAYVKNGNKPIEIKDIDTILRK